MYFKSLAIRNAPVHFMLQEKNTPYKKKASNLNINITGDGALTINKKAMAAPLKVDEIENNNR